MLRACRDVTMTHLRAALGRTADDDCHRQGQEQQRARVLHNRCGVEGHRDHDSHHRTGKHSGSAGGARPRHDAEQADTAADPSMITSIIRTSSRCDAGA